MGREFNPSSIKVRIFTQYIITNFPRYMNICNKKLKSPALYSVQDFKNQMGIGIINKQKYG